MIKRISIKKKIIYMVIFIGCILLLSYVGDIVYNISTGRNEGFNFSGHSHNYGGGTENASGNWAGPINGNNAPKPAVMNPWKDVKDSELVFSNWFLSSYQKSVSFSKSEYIKTVQDECTKAAKGNASYREKAKVDGTYLNKYWNDDVVKQYNYNYTSQFNDPDYFGNPNASKTMDNYFLDVDQRCTLVTFSYSPTADYYDNDFNKFPMDKQVYGSVPNDQGNIFKFPTDHTDPTMYGRDAYDADAVGNGFVMFKNPDIQSFTYWYHNNENVYEETPINPYENGTGSYAVDQAPTSYGGRSEGGGHPPGWTDSSKWTNSLPIKCIADNSWITIWNPHGAPIWGNMSMQDSYGMVDGTVISWIKDNTTGPDFRGALADSNNENTWNDWNGNPWWSNYYHWGISDLSFEGRIIKNVPYMTIKVTAGMLKNKYTLGIDYSGNHCWLRAYPGT